MSDEANGNGDLPDEGLTPAGEAEASVAGEQAHPIEGQVVLLAGAKASVPLSRLPDLLELVQEHLAERLADYRHQYECVHEDDLAAFLVPSDHWETLGAELDLDARETDAVRRAHEEQLLRIGRRTDRREEFEAALEIRTVVVIGA